MDASTHTSALRPALTWSVAAVVLVAVPTLLVAWAWLAGELPDREAWFAQSNHGPWRWEPSGLLVLAAIYGLLITGAGSLLHGAISAFRARQPRIIVPFVATAALSAALLHVVLSQLFWLID